MPPEQTTEQQAAVCAAELDPSHIEAILASHRSARSALIAILGDIQARYRYLPEGALRIVADVTGVPLADIYSVATFYHAFSLKPKGKHIVQCCLGTACHVRGGAGIAEELQRQLGILPGETTSDMQFSLETVNCLGACALGPVVVVDGRYYPKVKKSRVSQILRDAAAGSKETDAALDNRLIPIDVSCPHCVRSLMDESHILDGRASIGLAFSTNGSRGRASLSSLYGSSRLEMEPDAATFTAVKFSCPHCDSPLAGPWECYACGAAMSTVGLRGGGEVHFCSRRGCSSRLLDLEGSHLPNATDGAR